MSLFAPDALEGRVILVAGASGGIGREVALHLARAGARLLLTGRRGDALRLLVEEGLALGRPPESLEILAADLLRPEGAPGIVQRALARFQRLDAVVNAAGLGAFGAFHSAPVEAHWAQIEGNLGVAARLSHAALPALLASRGRFVQLVSGLATSPRREAAAYSAAQHGLQGLMHSLRLEYGAAGVRFSLVAVAGAGVDTPFWANVQPRVDRSAMLPPSAVAEAVLQVLQSEGRLHVDEVRLRTT